MGKYSDFPSQTPQMRPKFAIYIPKRDDGHLRHFYMGVPPPSLERSVLFGRKIT